MHNPIEQSFTRTDRGFRLWAVFGVGGATEWYEVQQLSYDADVGAKEAEKLLLRSAQKSFERNLDSIVSNS